MLNTRENMIEVLEGRTPEHTPFAVYDWNMERAVSSAEVAERMQRPAWRGLLDQGLGIFHHCEAVEAVEHGTESLVEEQTREGSVYRIERKRTPVGEVSRSFRDGWHHEDWIKTPEDYKVWTWIIQHTEVVPRYERVEAAEAAVGDSGVVLLTGSGNWIHRSPAMRINVDLAGTQQFCLDLALEVPELFELYDALKVMFLQEQKLLAAAPGRYVKWLENLSVEMLGPQRYRELLLSVYREAVPVLEAGNKRVFVHYDGALNIISDAIAEAPFHGVDSLTEAPEGDMSYEACRAAWPDKVLLGNINIDHYHQPPELLLRAVQDKVSRAGRKGFMLQGSEDLPDNWSCSYPVVLEALQTVQTAT